MDSNQINAAKERMARFMGGKKVFFASTLGIESWDIPDMEGYQHVLFYDTSMDWLHPVIFRIRENENQDRDLYNYLDGYYPSVFSELNVLFEWADKVLQYLEREGKL